MPADYDDARGSVGTQEARPPGRGRSPHRADVLVYPRVVEFGVAVPVEDRGVLLETGYAGGEWPAGMVKIEPLLAAPLGIRLGEWVRNQQAPAGVAARSAASSLMRCRPWPVVTMSRHACWLE